MTKFIDYKSNEKTTLNLFFDKWTCCLIESYIYADVEEVKCENDILYQYKYRTRFGIKNGICKKYYMNNTNDDKLLIETSFINGKLNGEFKEYSYFKKCIKHCFYKDGLLDGEYKEYYHNGSLKLQCHYINHKRSGEYCEYNTRGEIILYCSYINGYCEGEYIENNSFSNELVHCFYKDGFLEGEYKKWNKKNNELLVHAFYKGGNRKKDLLI